ncbi:Tfx family DNA-binding protein [Methanospirillum stamsii]|uniref:Transcriptional regulator n=1 Tax=Methanospirillum stamsii TaxID=1277351 RepID=A0A2V2N078_9EURY|nr:Tfx family DNA-binding protein [Methanospirillum stamsii]PWR73562.1 transcriptional regulator [Methanospirillum stamsii]
MKEGLLTDRQKEVLRYRRSGLTQQQIADIIHTSKANICTIEKSAMENIKRARETLDFFYSLDAQHLCTIEKGSDLFEAVTKIFEEAESAGIKVKYDSIQLMNRIRDDIPEKNKSRLIREKIEVYLKDDGDLYFE